MCFVHFCRKCLEHGCEHNLAIVTDRLFDRTRSLFVSLVKYQASKSGGNAKQANKENGDAVSDEVRWKFRV